MKFKTIFVLLCISILNACSQKSPHTYNSTLNLKQVMEWVIDPSADVVWDSVKYITTSSGTEEISPKTDADWESIRNSAATLIQAGNILMLDHLAKDNQQWHEFAKRLSTNAEVALKAAQNKDKDALFDAGGNIYNACKACHDKYANFDKPQN